MIILNEFIDIMEVIRIKMVAFYAEMPFDRFGKELRFAGVGLDDFVCVVQSWIIALTLWLKEVLNLRQDSLGLVSRLTELQSCRVAEFFPAN